MILEREILPTTVPEFPIVRMTLGMTSPIRESHGGEATEGVHGRLGPLVHWVYSRSLYQNKLVDDPGEEDERLVAPEVQGSVYLQDA